MQPLVLDTNVVLDALVFDDARAQGLLPALRAGQCAWFATLPMREELERVLAYPRVAGRLQAGRMRAADVLASFDRLACVVDTPSTAPVACSDADDQKFIDLAVERSAVLLSRDAAVLSLKQRLARLGVDVRTALAPLAEPTP